MPKNEYNDEEDQNDQQWDTIVIKKDPIIMKNNTVRTYDQFISLMINKREELKLSVLQLNTKCKFPYKYTIRDIESRKSIANTLEIRTISSVLGLN